MAKTGNRKILLKSTKKVSPKLSPEAKAYME